MILVGTDRDGVCCGRPLNTIGQHGQGTTELFFDYVRVPVANLIGTTEECGFGQLI